MFIVVRGYSGPLLIWSCVKHDRQEVLKLFFVLNSIEQAISTAYRN